MKNEVEGLGERNEVFQNPAKSEMAEEGLHAVCPISNCPHLADCLSTGVSPSVNGEIASAEDVHCI